MGLVKEPEGVDFIIKSVPLTTAEEKELSHYISRRKEQIAKKQKGKKAVSAQVNKG